MRTRMFSSGLAVVAVVAVAFAGSVAQAKSPDNPRVYKPDIVAGTKAVAIAPTRSGYEIIPAIRHDRLSEVASHKFIVTDDSASVTALVKKHAVTSDVGIGGNQYVSWALVALNSDGGSAIITPAISNGARSSPTVNLTKMTAVNKLPRLNDVHNPPAGHYIS